MKRKTIIVSGQIEEILIDIKRAIETVANTDFYIPELVITIENQTDETN